MPKPFLGPALLAIAAGVLSLPACSSAQPGNALPVTAGSSQPTSVGSSAVPSSSANAGASTSAIDPCSLISATEFAEYGSFREPTREDIGGARVCSLIRQRGSASDDTLSLGVGIRDSQGVDTVNEAGGGKITGNVNGRSAVRAPLPPSACILALAVGTGSRVDVSIVSTDPQKACDIAVKVGDVVEPKLPKV